MKNLKVMRESIEKEVDRIKTMSTSIEKDDLMQLSKELAGIHSAACELKRFLSDEIEEKKATAAKKAIEYLLSDGLSLQYVNIDGIRFEINGKEIIQQRYDLPFPDEDPDMPC